MGIVFALHLEPTWGAAADAARRTTVRDPRNDRMLARLRYFARRHLAPGLGALTGRERYARFREIAAHDEIDPEELRRIQMREIVALLEVARSEVPFYRELLQGRRIDEEVALPTLQSLPILRKRDFQREFDRLVSTRARRQKTYTMTTGGSTGSPLRLLYDDRAMERKQAGFMRSLTWGGWKLGQPIAMIWGGLQEIGKQESLAARAKTALSGTYLIGSYRYDQSMFPAWMDLIRRNGIRHLYGYASVLHRMARSLRETGRRMPRIDAVYSTAETLHPEHRATIEEVFQCCVHDQYGSREVANVASECDRGNMHIQTDMVYAEFVPAAAGDTSSPPGIVLTGFTNYAMPFIRYGIEDLGAARAGTCPCGRPFPLMDLRIGRRNDHFLKPNGEYVYPAFLTRLLDDVDGIASFQFHQRTTELISLRYVRDERFGPESERALRALEETVRSELDWQVGLQLEEVDELPVLDSGKHRFVLSDLIE